MKSKNSLFNLALFKSNIIHGTPLWVPYMIALLLLPIVSGLSYNYNGMFEQSISDDIATFQRLFDPEYLVYIAGIAGFVMAIWLFGYLNKSRSTNMIHAFPITRGELFVTHYISGLFMLIVPAVLAFIVEEFILMGYGIPILTIALVWVIDAIGLLVFFYSLSVFCCFLSGNTFATAFFYLFINIVYELIWFAFSMVVSAFGYGLGNYNHNASPKASFLCPGLYLLNNLHFEGVYSQKAHLIGLKEHGMTSILFYMLAAIVFVVLAFILYKKRQLELAGDFVAIAAIRPVMRWTITVLASVYAAAFLNWIMRKYALVSGSISFMVFQIIFGMLAFMISQMIIQKSFRVFDRRFFVEAASCVAFCLLIFVGMRTGAAVLERKIPDADQVKVASVSLAYDIEYTEDDIAYVSDLQQWIIDNKNKIYDRHALEANSSDIMALPLDITYTMEDGTQIVRNYVILLNSNSEDMIASLVARECDVDNFMKYIVDGRNYDNATMTFQNFSFDNYSLVAGYLYSTEISPEYSDLIYEAIQADVQAGVLQKYSLYYSSVSNFSDILYGPNENEYYQELNLNYMAQGIDYSGEEYYYYSSYSLPFGSDCTNIIAALIESGLIESEDDLIICDWSEYEE